MGTAVSRCMGTETGTNSVSTASRRRDSSEISGESTDSQHEQPMMYQQVDRLALWSSRSSSVLKSLRLSCPGCLNIPRGSVFIHQPSLMHPGRVFAGTEVTGCATPTSRSDLREVRAGPGREKSQADAEVAATMGNLMSGLDARTGESRSSARPVGGD